MKRTALLLLCLIFFSFHSCDRRKISRTDTETTGVAVIGADECFAPIVREELDVFTGLNPEAHVDAIYTGEKKLFDLLLSDSVRLIIATRELSEAEKESLKAKELTPRTQRIAGDGIALIVNKANQDSLINTETLKKVLTGKISDWSEISSSGKSPLGKINIVFDNPNSSTLRYISQSIVNGETLSTDLRALNSNPEVIEYVARTPNAMGVIGVNWISNPSDSTKLSFNETVRVMSVGVAGQVNRDNTYKPYPAFLNNGSYPLTRNVYIILTDLRGTLPAGVVKFVAGDAGQRIILMAGLVPGTRPTREINLKESFEQ